MLEPYLIGHCSPTLANLKTANLFGYRYDRTEDLTEQLEQLRQQLLPRGVELRLLQLGRIVRWSMSIGSGGWSATWLTRRSGSSCKAAAIGIFPQRARWHIWRGALRKMVENSRMRSGCFSAIRWGMSRALSHTEVRTASVPAAGRCTAMSRKPKSSSAGLQSADPFTVGCIRREPIFPG